MEARVRFFTLVGLLLFLTSLRSPHALYLSVIEISHSTQTSSTKVTVKVFTDDLQNAIRNFSSSYAHQPIDQFIDSNKLLILDYFKKNLLITINHQPKTLEILQFKKENDAHFIFFHIDSPSRWTDFQISAPYFTEIFADQSNILTLNYGEDSFYSRLNKSGPSYETTFR